jgi:amidase
MISASGLAARLDAWSERTGRAIGAADVEPLTWARAEQGRTFSAVQIHAAAQRLTAGVMRVPEWWASGHDLLVTPTMQQPPPAIAGLTPQRQGPIFGLFAMPYSITGQPAISLPLYWNAQNLPIGIQIVADYGREDLLIQIAAQLEDALPWMPRWLRMVEALYSSQ